MFASIKKKSNKQFRKKTAEEDESNDNNNNKPDQNPTANIDTPTMVDTRHIEQAEDDEFERKVKERAEKKKKVETTRKTTKPSVLSFDDEVRSHILKSYQKETEDTSSQFRITANTAATVNDTKSKKKSSRPMLNADQVTATAGVSALRNTSDYYTPENLEAMKKNQMNYNAPKKVKQQTQDDEDVDSMDVDSSAPAGEEVILNAEQADAFEDEEDEEIKRWEMEQIKKGGIQNQENDKVLHELEQHNQKILKQRDLNKRMSVLPSANGPRPSLDDMIKKLKINLTDLKGKHEVHVGQLARVETQIENAKSQIEIYDNETKRVADQYVWYQGMKNYVADLCACLAEKAPIIEDCEEQLVKVEVERLERNTNKLWFEQDNTKSDADYIEAKESVLKRAAAVFSDVNDEFATLSTIKERFEEWKIRDLASYRDAFVSLSMPQIFAPYVRLELLTWDPLSNASFESQQWYQLLFNYGIINNRMEENDEDNNLVPKLIEKVVAAKIASFANNVWNPRTEQQNRALLGAIDQVLIYIEPHSEAIKEIVAAVHVSLMNIVENIPLTIHDDALPDEVEKYLKIIKNTLSWSKFLSESIVNKIVLDLLINMRLTPFINKSKSKDLALETSEKIMNMVPNGWIEGGKYGKLGLLHSSLLGLLKKVTQNEKPYLDRLRKMMIKLNDREIVQKIDNMMK